MPARIVFMGSPEFALPGLRLLADHFDIAGVVTQPDRPAGRGRKLTPPPVKSLAVELGIPVIQPQKLREPGVLEQLTDWMPDVIVVAAFGQILRANVLNLPPHGCINVHGSLLPRWRGAAPVQAAILHGDAESGITIMLMDAGVDTGAMLSRRSTPLRPDDTAGTLSERLAQIGGDLLLETLPAYLAGNLTPQSQDESLATYAPKISKDQGEMDFSRPAEELERKVRAYHPWPGAFFTWQGQVLKVHKARFISSPAKPGERLVVASLPAVGCNPGILALEVVQPAGKAPMTGDVFLRGVRTWPSNRPA